MKPRKPNESDADYIKRLEASNRDMKARNDALAKWAANISEAVTHLATEGSLAFQAMAEKAGVRGHPSVTAAVEMFDKIAHPQWHRDDHQVPEVEFPRDWDFDADDEWSGDADMQLNSPVAEAMDRLAHIAVTSGKGASGQIFEVIGLLEKAIQKGIQGIKEKHGFKPKQVTVPTKHFRDMSREELEGMVSSMGWFALDLAQDMAFANEMLRRDLRAATYRRVCADLYALSQFGIADTEGPNKVIDIKVMGAEPIPF